MIKFITGSALSDHPELAATMFWDRRKQFRDRLQWPVKCSEFGFERDEYDSDNTAYIIMEGNDGRHLGSMRLMPTTGPTMINEHFIETLGNRKLEDPCVWECTRFCLAPKADQKIALSLFAAGAHFMDQNGLRRLVAVFNLPMARFYRKNGVSPTVIGSYRYSFGPVLAGYWEFDSITCNNLANATGLSNFKTKVHEAEVKESRTGNLRDQEIEMVHSFMC